MLKSRTTEEYVRPAGPLRQPPSDRPAVSQSLSTPYFEEVCVHSEAGEGERGENEENEEKAEKEVKGKNGKERAAFTSGLQNQGGSATNLPYAQMVCAGESCVGGGGIG